ncbi:hypothetical protein BURMUCF1_1752 [Burkholderia multivorans ATCC BAA-247]|nr:hypothetical protein BURMUCF1_1752 [Burkholderia multivorans ATCC BAA-247]
MVETKTRREVAKKTPRWGRPPKVNASAAAFSKGVAKV